MSKNRKNKHLNLNKPFPMLLLVLKLTVLKEITQMRSERIKMLEHLIEDKLMLIGLEIKPSLEKKEVFH
jgi:hypothetical protein